MRRSMRGIMTGTLVKNKYAIEDYYGITTSRIECHSPAGSNRVTEYVWVLWDNGEHCLFKIEMLEVINESR